MYYYAIIAVQRCPCPWPIYQYKLSTELNQQSHYCISEVDCYTKPLIPPTIMLIEALVYIDERSWIYLFHHHNFDTNEIELFIVKQTWYNRLLLSLIRHCLRNLLHHYNLKLLPEITSCFTHPYLAQHIHRCSNRVYDC